MTGGAGFIGRHVWRALERASYHTVSMDLAAGNDIREILPRDDSRFDVVVHCAAVVGGRRVIDWTPMKHAANLAADAALFEWAQRTRPGRLVYFSSSCAYPARLGRADRPGTGLLREAHIDLANPKWPDGLYGWAKLTGELLARTYRDAGGKVSVVRPFSVYGRGMNDGFAVTGFGEQVRRRADPLIIWGNADQVRDYIHVTDVADAVVAVLAQGADGPVNLGTGRATSLRELAALMAALAGYAPQAKVDESMPAGVPSLVADATLMRSFYEPRVTLEDGLAGMVS